MSTLTIYDGPRKVGQEAVTRLQTLGIEGSQKRYYYWLNENNATDSRRLALRILLRDSSYEIIRLGGYGKNREYEFYWTLKNRPVLYHEIVEEFLYNLENNFYPEKVMLPQHSYLRLLAFLTTVVDDETGKELWKFYPLNVYAETYDGMESLLQLVLETPYLPTYVLDSIWEDVQRRLQSELERLQTIKHEPDYETPQTAALKSQTLTACHIANNVKCNEALESFLFRCVTWLEEHVPKTISYHGGLYANTELAVRVLSKIDAKLALEYATRIVQYGCKPDDRKEYNQDFLCWLYGFAVKHGAKPASLDLIKKLFAK